MALETAGKGIRNQMNSPRVQLRTWCAVVLLMLLGMLNVMDRYLPAILVEPIKHDLSLSDAALGFINGVGFLLFYAGLALPIARVADRGFYGAVISASVALWGLMTVLGGMAQTGLHLILTRVGLAVGEAGSYPASQAYISRKFPADKRAAPQAILSLSVPLSIAAGPMVGALLGATWGWRAAFLVMGAVTLLTAPLVLLTVDVREKGAAQAERPDPARGDLRELLKKRSFLAILIGLGFIGMGGYTLAAFAPAFLMRSHHLAMKVVGVRYGLLNGLVSIPSPVIMGILVDRLGRRDPRWPLWLLAIAIAIFCPFAIAAFLVSSPWVSMGLLAAVNIIPAIFMVSTVVSGHRLAPVELRATASAIMLITTAVIGGLGPVIAGAISDALRPTLGAASLGRALLLVPAGFAMAAVCFVIATRRFREELAEPDGNAA
jgi:MFS family permease